MELVKILLPKLLMYISGDTKEVEGGKSGIAQVLVSFVGGLDNVQRGVLLPLLIQTLLRRLVVGGRADPAKFESLQIETAAQFMELVAVNQILFKEVLGGLAPEPKALLEETLKAGARASAAGRHQTSSSAAPAIALKMAF